MNKQLFMYIFQLIAILVFSTLAWLLYIFYIRPLRQSKRYARLCRDLGYSVYEAPFRPWSSTFADDMKEDAELHGDACYKEKTLYPQYDVIIQNIFNKVCISFVHPELIKDFFKPDITCHKKIHSSIRGIELVMGNGLVFRESDSWKTEKKILSKVFTFDGLIQNIPQMLKIVHDNISLMEDSHCIGQNKFQYYLLDLGNNIFQGIMMKCFFGSQQINQKLNGLTFPDFAAHVIDEANKLESHPFVLLFGKKALEMKLTKQMQKLNSDMNLFREVARDLIQRRKDELQSGMAEKRATDLIDAILNNPHVKDYSEDDLINEFITFLIAGTDSTAHLLMMMIYLLHDHPEIQKKLRAEIDQFISSKDEITFQNIKKLQYLDWIVTETTRYYGPGTNIFPREANYDQFIGKIPVTKGTGLFCHSVSNHYNTQYYKDPFEFRPERWESQCKNNPAYALMGFGGGPRVCTGKQLALLSAKVALISMLLRYERFQLPDVKRTFRLDFFYSPSPALTILYKKNVE